MDRPRERTCSTSSAGTSRLAVSTSACASARFGVTTVAAGSRSTSAWRASGSSRCAPLSATITGSRTTGARRSRSSASRTASIVSTVPSIPIFTASTPMSSAPPSPGPRSPPAGTGVTPWTATVFCQVTAVIAVIPCTPQRANAFRSAWIPAPPPESEPAIDSTRGMARVEASPSKTPSRDQHMRAQAARLTRATPHVAAGRRRGGRGRASRAPSSPASTSPTSTPLGQGAPRRPRPAMVDCVRGPAVSCGRQPRAAASSPTLTTAGAVEEHRARPGAAAPAARRRASSRSGPAASGDVDLARHRATSRPRSCAKSAVISEPEPVALRPRPSSRQRPAMIRLRAGKRQRNGRLPGGISETTSPSAAMRRCRCALRAGTRRRRRRGITATVRPRRLERPLVGGRVDPERHPADDRHAARRQVARRASAPSRARRLRRAGSRRSRRRARRSARACASGSPSR